MMKRKLSQMGSLSARKVVLSFPFLCGYLFFLFIQAALPVSVQGQSRRRAFDTDPLYRQHNLTGNSYFEQHLYKRAADEYSLMISMKPKEFDGYVLRGMAYHRMKAYSQAIADDTRAISLQPIPRFRTEIYYNRGLSHSEKGDMKEAIADFGQALALGGPEPDTYRERGIAYSAIQKEVAAMEDFTKAIRLKPNDASLYRLRGTTYIKLHNYSKAIADEKQAIKIDPRSIFGWGDLGWAQFLAGDVRSAIETNKKAQKIDPHPFWLCGNLGLCYAVQGDWASAETQYRAGFPSATTEGIKAALDDIREALRKHPNLVPLKQAQALLQSRLGRK